MFFALALSSVDEPAIPQIFVNPIDSETFDFTSTETSTTEFPFIPRSESNITLDLVSLPNITLSPLPESNLSTCSQIPGCPDLMAKLTPQPKSEHADAITWAQRTLKKIVR